MISLIIGENSFENARIEARIIAEFGDTPEKLDGEILELKSVPDILMGVSLFASKRLVIIKNLSANRALWNVFAEWIDRISRDIHLVLVDAKPDKRTKTYKLLSKEATIYESKLWTERDIAQVEQWVIEESKQLGYTLDKKSTHTLIDRVGVDQWLLYQALQKLAVVDVVTPEVIKEIIDANPTESVFNLFEAALKGQPAKVKEMIGTLQLVEDPYRLFGLMSGQAFQLLALTISDKPASQIASDIGAHPFALSKLAPYAKKIEKTGAKKILAAFVQADNAMKTSAAEPWLLIERALIKIASQ